VVQEFAANGITKVNFVSSGFDVATRGLKVGNFEANLSKVSGPRRRIPLRETIGGDEGELAAERRQRD